MKSSSQRNPLASRTDSLCASMPPKRATAARLASSGVMPSRSFLSASMSMWSRTSSSSRRSASSARKKSRTRRTNSAGPIMSPSPSRRAEDELDRTRVTTPDRHFVAERASALAGERVDPRAAVVLGHFPRARDQASVLQPLQRRVQGSLVDREHSPRELLNPLADPPPVHWFQREGFQHEQIERAA